jgi:hypothetical protein
LAAEVRKKTADLFVVMIFVDHFLNGFDMIFISISCEEWGLTNEFGSILFEGTAFCFLVDC